MRLSINGWPPVASHMLAFIFGITLMNLYSTPLSEDSQIQFHRQRVMLPFPERFDATKSESVWPVKETVYVTLEGEEQSCRLYLKEDVHVVQNAPFYVLEVHLKDVPSLYAFLEEKKQTGNMKLQNLTQAQSLPLCALDGMPRIQYGENNRG